MKLTNEEKNILALILQELDIYYNEQVCNWQILRNNLPITYIDNIKNTNFINIQDKKIEDIKKAKEDSHKIIMKLINEL